MLSIQIKKILQLRYCQMMRVAYDLGSLAVFMSVGIILLLYLLSFVLKDKTMNIPVFIGLFIAMITIHNARNDKAFLDGHFDNTSLIYRIEYGILLSPIFLLSIFNYNWQLPLYLIGILLCLPYLNYNKTTFHGNSFVNFVPTMLFEWKSGLRKTYLVPVLLYSLAYISVMIKFLPMVLLFFCSTSVATFYDENEDVLLLERFGQTAKKIFYNKIKLSAFFIIKLYTPVMVLSSLIYPDIALVNFLFLINQIVLIVFIITVKYKHYLPLYNPIRNSNFTATFILLSAFPGFFFIPLIYVLAYHRKAINKIDQFL